MTRRNAVGDTLTEGQKLVKGESLTSTNGAYTLTLQDDGNLVLASRGHAIWATGTNRQDVVRPKIKPDDTFVLYTADKPVWHSDTKGKKNVRLVLQDDRNLVLYAADGPALWPNTQDHAPPPAAVGRARRGQTGVRAESRQRPRRRGNHRRPRARPRRSDVHRRIRRQPV